MSNGKNLCGYWWNCSATIEEGGRTECLRLKMRLGKTLIGLLCVCLLVTAVWGQDPNQEFPAPISNEELDALADDLQLSVPQRLALDYIFSRYLEQGGEELAGIKREFDIEFAQAALQGSMHPHDPAHSALKRLIHRHSNALHRWDDWLLAELEPILSEEQVPILPRLRNDRIRTLSRAQPLLIPVGDSVPADLSQVVMASDIDLARGSELDLLLIDYELRITPQFRRLFEARAGVWAKYTREMAKRGFPKRLGRDAPNNAHVKYNDANRASLPLAVQDVLRIVRDMQRINDTTLRRMCGFVDEKKQVALLANFLDSEVQSFQSKRWISGLEDITQRVEGLNEDNEATYLQTAVWYRQEQIKLLHAFNTELTEQRDDLYGSIGEKGYSINISQSRMDTERKLLAVIDKIKGRLEAGLGKESAFNVTNIMLLDFAGISSDSRRTSVFEELSAKVVGSGIGMGYFDISLTPEEYDEYVRLLGLGENQAVISSQLYKDFVACREKGNAERSKVTERFFSRMLGRVILPTGPCETDLFENLRVIAPDKPLMVELVDRVRAYRKRRLHCAAWLDAGVINGRIDLVRLARTLGELDDEEWRENVELREYENRLDDLLAQRSLTFEKLIRHNEKMSEELDRLSEQGDRSEISLHQRQWEADIAEGTVALRDRNHAVGELNEDWIDRWPIVGQGSRLRATYKRLAFPKAFAITMELETLIAYASLRDDLVPDQRELLTSIVTEYRDAERVNWKAIVDRRLRYHPVLARVRYGIIINPPLDLVEQVEAARRMESEIEDLLEKRESLSGSTRRRMEGLLN